MTILLALNAYALECTDRDVDACEAANRAADQINAVAGDVLVEDDAARSRLRTERLYDRFVQIQAVTGCAIDGVVTDGTLGGVYDSAGFTTEAADVDDGNPLTVLGTIDRDQRTFVGDGAGDVPVVDLGHLDHDGSAGRGVRRIPRA